LARTKLFIVSETTVPALAARQAIVAAIKERLGEGPNRNHRNVSNSVCFFRRSAARPIGANPGDAFPAPFPNDYALVREAIDSGCRSRVKSGQHVTAQLKKLIRRRR